MAGNVREWVQDSYYAGYTNAPTDGSARCYDGRCPENANDPNYRNYGPNHAQYKTQRGGSWTGRSGISTISRSQSASYVRLESFGGRLARRLQD